ncbi:MAG: DUF1998 domain-containing protein, partial [Lentisphaerae bacterium]|nr:DUF1998 domain-containing protein [Lentisphaerota bacterium]
ELAAEPLPLSDERRQILMFEASEGGAGVLRRLVEDGDALHAVAAEALRICHFDPTTGDDLKKADSAKEECTKACYDCLMGYANQPDHLVLDRHLVRDYLMQLSTATVTAGAGETSRTEVYERLLGRCDSNLEKRFLSFLQDHGLRLPDDSQVMMTEFSTKPDFVYRDLGTVVYVDGPPHDFPDRQKRDQHITVELENAGYTVVRVKGEDTWQAAVDQFPDIFGAGDP